MEGKTPKLRFREFSDFWKTKKLGNVVEITSASRVHKDEWTEIGIPFYRSSDIVAAFKGLNNTKAYISEELYKSLTAKTGCVKKNDILVTGGGSIGIPFLVKTDDPLYFKDADLLWLKNNEKVNGSFLFCFFTTPTFRKYLESISHIGTIAHYTVIQAKNTPFNSPSLPEQRKIASFLSSVDERIELLEQKKEKLEAYKKGVMQQIFSQQIRFKPARRGGQDDGSAFPDWEEKRLGELTFKTGKKNREGKVLPTYSINNIVGFLPQSEQFDGINSYERGFDTKSYKIVEKNMFAYNPARINVGSIGFSGDLENVLISSLYVCFKTVNDLDSHFLLQFMKTYTFTKAVLRNTEGGVRDYLFYENFSKIKIMFPSREEQKKIAAFLNSIDENLKTLNSQIQGLRTWKKGLLQQMFV